MPEPFFLAFNVSGVARCLNDERPAQLRATLDFIRIDAELAQLRAHGPAAGTRYPIEW